MSKPKVSIHAVLRLFVFAISMIATGAQAKNFIGYTGKTWASDFGVLKGQCDSRLVQAEVAKGNLLERMAFVQSDASFQALFPQSSIVDALAIDAHCFGHTMELVPSGQAVRWLNPANGVGVHLSPGARSDSCRTFLGVTVVNGEKKKFRGEVCSVEKGVWQIQP